MKRILFLTPQLPYPPTRGGTLVSWRLLSYLSERADLTLGVLMKPGDSPQQAEALQREISLGALRGFPQHVPRSARALAASYLAGIPLNLYRNRNAEMQAWAAQETERHDLVLADHYEMYPFVPAKRNIPAVYHAHNAEHQMWERFAAADVRPLRALAARIEALRVRQAEARICRDADRVLAFPNDAEALRRLAPAEKFIEILPAGDDRLLEAPLPRWEETGPLVFYAGTLSWEANIDGLCWFLEQCWPEIKRQVPEARLRIAGAEAAPRVEEAVRRAPDAELLGLLPDLEPWYRQTRVFIAPLRFGSGIKLKVLNALLRGLPTVSSSVGAEGLPLTAGHELAVCDTAPSFSAAVAALLQERERWEAQRDHARHTAALRLSGDQQLARAWQAIEALLHP
jgi:glycosyltransferase involved in cell wall biosynthesis